MTPKKQEMVYRSLLKLAADDPRSLRACDVDRLFEEASSRPPVDKNYTFLEGFCGWLKSQPISDAVRVEVDQWSPS